MYNLGLILFILLEEKEKIWSVGKDKKVNEIEGEKRGEREKRVWEWFKQTLYNINYCSLDWGLLLVLFSLTSKSSLSVLPFGHEIEFSSLLLTLFSYGYRRLLSDPVFYFNNLGPLLWRFYLFIYFVYRILIVSNFMFLIFFQKNIIGFGN